MQNEKTQNKDGDKVATLKAFYDVVKQMADWKELKKTDKDMLNKVYANLKGRIQQLDIFT